MKDIFQFLTLDDLRLLREKARRVIFEPDEVILAEGSRRQALFVIQAGRARVEILYRGASVPIAEVEAGEMVGEMSFVENEGASASVVADDRSEVDVIESADVHSLLESVPGFSTRFYRSLAVMLSSRLRARTVQWMPPFNGG